MFLKQLHFLISPEHKKSYLSPLWLQEILMYNFYLCRCHLLSYPDDRKNTQELHGGEGEVVFRMSLFNVWWVKATTARMFLHLLKCLLATFPPQISKVKAHLLKHQNFPLLRSFYYQKKWHHSSEKMMSAHKQEILYSLFSCCTGEDGTCSLPLKIRRLK